MTLPILPQSIRLCTDSRSSLQTLSKGHFHQSSQTGFQIWEQISSLLVAGTNLFLVWVPGHSGLPGNDLADSLASSASSLPQVEVPINKHTANMAIRRHINLFQLDSSPDNLPPRPSDFSSLSRKEQTIFSQLRTGHSSLTNDTLYKFNKIDSPLCSFCLLTSDSISHLLTSCPALYNSRLKFFSSNAPPLTYILSFSARTVLPYLREVGRV